MKCLREVLCVRDKNKLSKHERLCGGFLNSKPLVHNVGLGIPQSRLTRHWEKIFIDVRVSARLSPYASIGSLLPFYCAGRVTVCPGVIEMCEMYCPP